MINKYMKKIYISMIHTGYMVHRVLGNTGGTGDTGGRDRIQGAYKGYCKINE